MRKEEACLRNRGKGDTSKAGEQATDLAAQTSMSGGQRPGEGSHGGGGGSSIVSETPVLREVSADTPRFVYYAIIQWVLVDKCVK